MNNKSKFFLVQCANKSMKIKCDKVAIRILGVFQTKEQLDMHLQEIKRHGDYGDIYCINSCTRTAVPNGTPSDILIQKIKEMGKIPSQINEIRAKEYDKRVGVLQDNLKKLSKIRDQMKNEKDQKKKDELQKQREQILNEMKEAGELQKNLCKHLNPYPYMKKEKKLFQKSENQKTNIINSSSSGSVVYYPKILKNEEKYAVMSVILDPDTNLREHCFTLYDGFETEKECKEYILENEEDNPYQELLIVYMYRWIYLEELSCITEGKEYRDSKFNDIMTQNQRRKRQNRQLVQKIKKWKEMGLDQKKENKKKDTLKIKD